MKKIIYLCAVVMACVACNRNANQYTIKGTVDGAQDGDIVYLKAPEGCNWITIDSAIIKTGAFVMKGQADTLAVNRYLTYQSTPDRGMAMDFFLENGNIQVKLSKAICAATGTPANDIYQAVKGQINPIAEQMQALYADEAYADTTLTTAELEAKHIETVAKAEKLEERISNIIKNAIEQNINNAVGVHLLTQNYYYMSGEELAPLMDRIPTAYANDEVIITIKDKVKKLQATAVGQKFTDFEMQNPDGKSVKLSDYAGKGKVVLVDFWASWCGPCRQEMPNLVEIYAQYKNKNFEIVGVSLDHSLDNWKAAIKKLKMTWPQMSDLKHWDSEGADIYGVSSIPHTVLIDDKGVIIARGLHGEALQKKLADLLKL